MNKFQAVLLGMVIPQKQVVQGGLCKAGLLQRLLQLPRPSPQGPGLSRESGCEGEGACGGTSGGTMRRGEPQRDSQTLRLRVRRNYCWDEKTEKGEKKPRLCRVGWHATIGEAGEGHRRQKRTGSSGLGSRCEGCV